MDQEDTPREPLRVPRDTRSLGFWGTEAAAGQWGPGSPTAPGPIACAGDTGTRCRPRGDSSPGETLRHQSRD